MRQGLETLYRVAWFDLSGGKIHKKQRSRSAYTVLGQDDLERIFILEAYGAHVVTSDFVEKIFRCEQRWQLRTMGFDASATQDTFVDMLEMEARKSNRRLPAVHREHLEGQKVARIENNVQPLTAQGRLFRPPESACAELKSEWESFPGGFYMDILDCLACAVQFLLPKKPKRVVEGQQAAELRLYLRNMGAGAEYIEKRVRELYPQVGG